MIIREFPSVFPQSFAIGRDASQFHCDFKGRSKSSGALPLRIKSFAFELVSRYFCFGGGKIIGGYWRTEAGRRVSNALKETDLRTANSINDKYNTISAPRV